jgi:hypothetical protein
LQRKPDRGRERERRVLTPNTDTGADESGSDDGVEESLRAFVAGMMNWWWW